MSVINVSDILHHYLSEFYAAQVLHKISKDKVVPGFKEELEKNAELKSEAEDELNRLNKLDASTGGNLSKRCYVSHIQRMALEEALNG